MKIRRRPLVKTIKLYNVDGTENKQGEMTHRCQLRIKYKGKEDLQDFYITNLGKDRIILGYPFLEKFNPKIDWSEGRLTEGPVVILLRSGGRNRLSRVRVRVVGGHVT